MSTPRPVAWRHLTRINELVTNASICRVAQERDLVQDEAVARCAAADEVTAEEVEALARDRRWTLPHNKSYAWSMLSNFSDPLPRIVRVIDRDIFELDGICRGTDDDEVAALAQQLLAQRRLLKRELEGARPELGLPGAK